MADLLGTKGKIAGMTGIKSAIVSLRLDTVGGSAVTTVAQAGTNFTVNTSTGELTNDNAITFTVDTDDIGKVITNVVYLDTNSQALMTIDLDTSLTLSHAGTVTFAIGDISATL